MNWVIVDPGYVHEGGGGNWVYVREFARALKKKGYSVSIVMLTEDRSKSGIEDIGGIKHHKIYSRKKNSGPLRIISKRVMTRYLIDLCKKEKIDVINPHGAFSILYGNYDVDSKIVHTLHSVITYEYTYEQIQAIKRAIFEWTNITQILMLPFKLPVSYFLEKLALQKARKIIVMSQYVKGTIRMVYGRQFEEKILVSRIGVDESFSPVAITSKYELRQRFSIEQDVDVFFTVRRLSWRMGLHNLLNAIQIVKNSGCDAHFILLIAGKGILDSNLKSYASKLDINDCVRFLGYVNDKDLRDYYRLADCFLMPTEQLEGFGIATLEALASNLPEIATPAGANPEVLNQFHPELICDGVKPKFIAEKIMYYLQRKKDYQHLDNSERVKSIYNWGDIVAEIVNVCK